MYKRGAVAGDSQHWQMRRSDWFTRCTTRTTTSQTTPYGVRVVGRRLHDETEPCGTHGSVSIQIRHPINEYKRIRPESASYDSTMSDVHVAGQLLQSHSEETMKPGPHAHKGRRILGGSGTAPAAAAPASRGGPKGRGSESEPSQDILGASGPPITTTVCVRSGAPGGQYKDVPSTRSARM